MRVTKTFENNTESVLSHDELAHIVNATITCFDTQFSLVTNDKESITIASAFLDWHGNIDISTFFVLANLQKVSGDICDNTSLRSFIFNFADRVSFLLSPMGNRYEDEFLDKFVHAISRNRKDPLGQQSLINTEVIQTLYINVEVLRNLLINNIWLLSVYIVLMYFHETQLHKSLIPAKTNKSETHK